MGFAHPFDLPVSPVIEDLQPLFVPAPLADQLAEDFPPPTDSGVVGLRQLLADLQIEAAANQVKAGGIVDFSQVVGDALQHHAIGIKAEADDLPLVQTMFDPHRQQLSFRVFP
ncbi:hypothetical protein D3C78_1644660 [compost metagenome]